MKKLNYGKIAWCTGHYKTDFTKEKAKELRKQGYHVIFNNYIKEGDNSYCKIYLTKDINYYVLEILKSIKTYILHGEKTFYEAITNKETKEKICEIAKMFKTRITLETDHYKVYSVLTKENGEKEELEITVY